MSIATDFTKFIGQAITAADFLREDNPENEELDNILDQLFEIQERFKKIEGQLSENDSPEY